MLADALKVEDELVKIVRRFTHEIVEGNDEEYTSRVLSAVRFASLASNPSIETIVPSRIWNPADHHSYPESFRSSCRTLLLCSRANYCQKTFPKPVDKVNAAGMLPRAVWMEILSYAHRDCKLKLSCQKLYSVKYLLIKTPLKSVGFETPKSEVAFLRQRLAEEKAKTQRLNKAKLEAEARFSLAEKERDAYRHLVQRLKARLSASLPGTAVDAIIESTEEADAAMLLDGGGGIQLVAPSGTGRELSRYFCFRTGELESDVREEGNSEMEDAEEASYDQMMVNDDSDSQSLSSSSDAEVLTGSGNEAQVSCKESMVGDTAAQLSSIGRR